MKRVAFDVAAVRSLAPVAHSRLYERGRGRNLSTLDLPMADEAGLPVAGRT